MKYITKVFLYTITVLSIFSCKFKSRPSDASTESFKTFDTIVPFAGCWLSENYYNSVTTEKSPRKAQIESELLVIPNKTLMPVKGITNFHEGSIPMVILKGRNSFELWNTQEDSLLGLLSKIVVSNDKIKIGGNSFVKITPSSDEMILEEILFKGSYKTGDGKEIKFKNNGECSGIDNFKYYCPFADYIGPGANVDLMLLGETKETMKKFGFKYKADTLELYGLKCIEDPGIKLEDCYEIDFDKLVYSFIKQ